MNKSIEEINKLVDMVIEDQDVQDALIQRFLDDNLDYLKRKKAYQDGEQKKKIDIAKKMLDKKIDINIISQCTELSIEEIEKLK